MNYFDNEADAQETLALIKNVGGEAIAVQGDMTKAAAVKNLFAECNKAQIAFAITNLRVIAAQKKMFSDTVIAIPISHINDLTTKTKLTRDFIIIGNDAGENLTISVYKGLGTSVANALHLAMASSDRRLAEPDVASDLRKFKALLDDGIITEDEFLKKKQQLLGL